VGVKCRCTFGCCSRKSRTLAALWAESLSRTTWISCFRLQPATT
jgi:hypothetical protein